MGSVSLRGVTKVFDQRVTALYPVSLDVADGEFVAILGPSGCGKSTILRCVAGLESVSGGQILIGDRDVTTLPPAERDTAMVFQNYALYPHLTVRENLEFPLRMRRIPRADWGPRVRRVGELLGLEELQARLPAQLSGGQRQRVALGRALVREPAVFLFDEPLSNLDAALRAQLRQELMGLHATLRATMLYVTHDQVEALTMGQRVVVMREGQVQQVGAPEEIYDRPANAFVAGFVGKMNLIAEAGRQADGAGFAIGGVKLPVPPSLAGRAATLGIRPEHVELTAPGKGASGEVTLVERLGSETLVHIRAAGAIDLVARVPGFSAVAAGDRVGLRLDPARLHWFDPDGRRS